jgi:excisionase family DNA binding protein
MGYKIGETLDIEGAATFLKMSKWTVYQMTRRNEVPVHRPCGKKLVFFKKELERFILRGTKKPRK